MPSSASLPISTGAEMAALIHPARAVPGVGTKAVAGLPVASQRANGNKKKTYIMSGFTGQKSPSTRCSTASDSIGQL